MSLYTYPMGATLVGSCDLEKLQRQIEENAAIVTACVSVTVVDQLTIEIEMASALSSGEVLALDAVVAAHQPGPPSPEAILVTDRNLAYDSQGRLMYDSQGDVLLLRDS